MECRIREHDAHQFEIKLGYPLDRDCQEQRFHLDLYFFFPYQIGVDPDSYLPDRLYPDLTIYTRLKTPLLTLRAIADTGNDLSPLTRVERAATDARWPTPEAAKLAVYELKMCASIVRAQLRDAARRLRRSLRAVPSDDDRAKALRAANILCDDLDALLGRFRGLAGRLAGPDAPETVASAFALADEYISLQVEFRLVRLLRAFDRPTTALEEARPTVERLRGLVRAELAHRRAAGMTSLVSLTDARANERFLYREGLLKKFCAEVLFLSVDRRPGGVRTRQFLSAAAAGAAMSLGVALLGLVAWFYPVNTLPFAVAAVVVYILRDRLKETARTLGARLLPRWVVDRYGKLVERREGRTIGETRERTRWIHEADLPRDVAAARRHADLLDAKVLEPNEFILLYRRIVRVRTGLLLRLRRRARAIDDILRVQVGRWLHRMDNPLRSMVHFDEATGRVTSVEGAQVYHVHLIARLYCPATGETLLRKVRLDLTQQGIVRVKERKTGDFDRAP